MLACINAILCVDCRDNMLWWFRPCVTPWDNMLWWFRPCVTPWEAERGGPNNVSDTYTNAYEISRGCWDGYGQLGVDYALQSGVHMRNVYHMIQAITGMENTPRKNCSTVCNL